MAYTTPSVSALTLDPGTRVSVDVENFPEIPVSSTTPTSRVLRLLEREKERGRARRETYLQITSSVHGEQYSSSGTSTFEDLKDFTDGGGNSEDHWSPDPFHQSCLGEYVYHYGSGLLFGSRRPRVTVYLFPITLPRDPTVYQDLCPPPVLSFLSDRHFPTLHSVRLLSVRTQGRNDLRYGPGSGRSPGHRLHTLHGCLERGAPTLVTPLTLSTDGCFLHGLLSH